MPNVRDKKMPPEQAARHKKAGEYVAGLRTKRGLSQMDFNNRVKLGKYYTMVSAIETGSKTKVPPASLIPMARTLGVDHKVFAKTLLRYYEPFWFEALFGTKED